MNNNFHPPIFRAIHFVVGFLLMSFTGQGQVWPVEVFPSINMPYPACLADYANDQPSTQRMQLSLLLRDITVSHRQVRLKVYIQGGGMSIQGSDNTEGTPAIYLDGGSLYRMDNSQLAPFFRFGNLMGISPDQYASTLPSGVYTIGFEVYDFNTNQRLSLRQNAYLQIILNDPPLLNLPAKGNEVSSRLPQSVVFNWTPRQMGAFVSEYELSLVEVWDEGVSPEAAFLSAPPMYRETVRATSLYYGPAQPSLVPGHRYAWRVQAKAREGATYIHTYRNDGYSEIGWFAYEAPLIAPENLRARFTGEHSALFEWDGQPNCTGYRFEIRPAGTDKWYAWEVTAQEFESSNLTPGRNYEWRVTGIKANNNSAMSQTVQYRQPATEPEPYKNCGDRTALPPITNHTPMQQLSVGDKFTVNGSPITVEEVTSSNGGAFSGLGWTVLPFLGNYKIAVRFVDAMINTDYQLLSGYAETVTDKQKKGIIDVDKAIKTIKDGIRGISEGGAGAGNESTAYTSSDITVAMDLSEVKKVGYDAKTGKLTISSNGATQTYTVDNKPATKDQPVVVADSGGKLYSIDQKTGTVSPMGTPESPVGLAEEKGKSIVVTFANAPGDATAFCAFDPVYDGAFNNKMEILEMADGQKYRVPAKLMVAGGGNGQVVATVQFKGSFDPKKVFFRTFAGEEWPSELNIDKRSYTVTVKPGRTDGATDLFVHYQPKGSDKPELVGKLKIYTYNAVNKEVVLVPIAKATIPDGLADELTKIYKPYGVNLTVTSKKDSYPELWWDTDGDHLLDATGTSRLSRYSEEMKRLNSSYRLDEQGYFRKDALYLFVLAGAKTDDGLPLAGDMPRGKQFGYVFFSSPSGGGQEGATTCAHELGHGIFHLSHTFDEYGYAPKSTQNLMDYPSTSSGQAGGKELVKYQWDILHDTGIAGWLDDATDAMALESNMPADSIIAVINKIRNANKKGNSILDLTRYAASKGIKKGLGLSEIKLEYTDIRTLGGRINTSDAGLYINPSEMTLQECETPKGETGYFAKLTFNRYKPKTGTSEFEKASGDGVIIYVKAKQAPRLKEYILNQSVTKIEFPCEKCGRELKLTYDKLSEIYTKSKILKDYPEVVNYFNEAFKNGEINTCQRQAHLLSQCDVESGGLNVTTEMTSYCLDRMLDIFKSNQGSKEKWFKQSFWDSKDYLNYVSTYVYEQTDIKNKIFGDYDAVTYRTYRWKDPSTKIISKTDTIRAPLKNKDEDGYVINLGKGNFKKVTLDSDRIIENGKRLLNVAYKSMNGNVLAEDGYNFRGRGAIQLTGRYNYEEVEKTCDTVLKTSFNWKSNPDDIGTKPKDIVYSAIGYLVWKCKDLTKLDTNDSYSVTKLVNAASLEKERRKIKFETLMKDIFKNCNINEK